MKTEALAPAGAKFSSTSFRSRASSQTGNIDFWRTRKAFLGALAFLSLWSTAFRAPCTQPNRQSILSGGVNVRPSPRRALVLRVCLHSCESTAQVIDGSVPHLSPYELYSPCTTSASEARRAAQKRRARRQREENKLMALVHKYYKTVAPLYSWWSCRPTFN